MKKRRSKEERDNEYLGIANIEQRKIEIFKEKISNASGIKEDVRLNELITNDMISIWEEVGGQDGMYENFPIFRIYRDNKIIRIYGLDGNGGVCIIVSNNEFQILTLGEDDAYHFLNSYRVYESYRGNKVGFLYLLSETLSYFNNISLKC